jgi:hypothetical protein
MKKKLSDYVQSDDNLFLTELLPTFKADAVYSVLKKVEDGLLLPTTGVKIKDEENFIKWYRPCYEGIGELSNSGVRVLSYILKRLKTNKDWVLIDMDECMAHCGYTSVQAVRNGLLELLEYRYIQRKSGGANMYFINPNYFFNGQRHMIDTLFDYTGKMKKDLIDNMKLEWKLKKEKAEKNGKK